MSQYMPIGLIDANSEIPPNGTRRFTKKEITAAGQIAMSIVNAGKHGAIIHKFTTDCINAYDLPGYPPNSKGRIAIFRVLLELAEEIVRNEPPPPPNTFAMIRHIIDWTGDE